MLLLVGDEEEGPNKDGADDCPKNVEPVTDENGPLVAAGVVPGLGTNGEAGGSPKADFLPDLNGNALKGEPDPNGEGEVEAKGFGEDDGDDAVVLSKTDFERVGLGAPKTEVLPKALGVVERLEKADCVNWDEDVGADVVTNGLDDVEDTPNADVVGFGPELSVTHSVAVG